MATALPHPELVSQSSSRARTYRTLRAQFGDGYSQRASDGINDARDTWSVNWENVDSTEYATITAALDAVSGWDILTWTPPNEGTSKNWTIMGDTSYTAKSGDLWDITVQLQQEFDI